MQPENKLFHSSDIRMKGFKEKRNVSEFLKIIDENVLTINEFEIVDLHHASGRVLAITIKSEINVPGFNRSAMDGYALKGEETFGADLYAPLEFKIIGVSLPAKPFEGKLELNNAVRIMTGSPMPLGADAVIPFELAKEEGGILKVIEAIPPGKNVGKIGEDVRVGQEIFPPGRKIRPQDVGLLASIGFPNLKVLRKPVVEIFITGDELLPPGSMPIGSKIVDSNSVMLESLVFRDIACLPKIIRLQDSRELIKSAIIESDADFILISGGSSVGQEDHAPTIVSELGEILIHGVALRPASPSGMGKINKKVVFLIPGNPVSCLCAYDLFASRAIRKFAGLNYNIPYRTVFLQLGSKVSSMVGRMDYVRVKISNQLAEPLAISGASMLSTTTFADGFILVPPECEGFPAGEKVEIYLYDLFL